MAFVRVLRRTASLAAPLVSRAVWNTRAYRSTGFSPLKTGLAQGLPRTTAILSQRFISSSAKPSSDEEFLKIIESEIKCAKDSDDHDRVESKPEGFPFTIEDNPGEVTILLKREYQGESITVQVHMPNLVTGEDGDDDDGANENGSQPSIPLVVLILKGSGPSLKFDCTAYPDEIAIDSMSVLMPETSEDEIAYEGPDFEELDENLQRAFHKYLDMRDIKPSTTNYLYEYMVNKDSREYLTWLQKLKNFIEK